MVKPHDIIIMATTCSADNNAKADTHAEAIILSTKELNTDKLSSDYSTYLLYKHSIVVHAVLIYMHT